MKSRLLFFVALIAVFAALAQIAWHAAGGTAFAQEQQSAQPAAAPAPAATQEQAQPAKGQTPAAQNQAPSSQDQAAAPNGPVIKSESRLVRVDAVVTDKKGNYITDLGVNDFKVFEDSKQQQVSTFYFGADGAATTRELRHYMVLFFDNSTMDFGDQARARAAAAKFIDANAGADRLMAVVNFTGVLNVTQNFTPDVARLKTAVTGLQSSSVSPNAPPASADTYSAPTLPGMSPLGSVEADFGSRTVLIALRNMAESLVGVPGRKSLVLFTSGFPITEDVLSELTATIDACNKANVAIYPLDVRGLAAPNGSTRPFRGPNVGPHQGFEYARSTPNSAGADLHPHLVLASYTGGTIWALPQHGGGGAGGGGVGGGGGGGGVGGGGGGRGGTGGTGGGTGGTGSGGGGKGGTGSGGSGGRGGGGGTTTAQPGTSTISQPRSILPTMPDSPINNQQILAALADGTGGFTIFNTNDFLPGLEKIAREQNAYYLLGYAPAESKDGACHTLKVKVERAGTNVRSRTGYCNVKPPDILAGRPVEKTLEAHAAGTGAGNIGGSLETAFFYTAPKTARVNLSMDVASSSFEFAKEKGKYHSGVDILGIAYKSDGSVGARFSDSLTLDFDKEQMKSFTEAPWHYQNQFSIAPGAYRLVVTLSGGGQAFGKYESPLLIEPYDGKKFTLSAIVLSSALQRVTDAGTDIDSMLLEDRTPLVVKGYQVLPSGSDRFKKTDKLFLYTQIYEPKISDPKPPEVRIGYRVMDVKSGKQVFASGALETASFALKGSPVIPVGLKVPLDGLGPGTYRLDMQAGEVAGAITPVRSVNFEID